MNEGYQSGIEGITELHDLGFCSSFYSMIGVTAHVFLRGS
jgi:hypothetical protein